MSDSQKCAGSGLQWKRGVEGGRYPDGRPRRPQGRAECPVCRKSWRQLGRTSTPQVNSPHHTVPVH